MRQIIPYDTKAFIVYTDVSKITRIFNQIKIHVNNKHKLMCGEIKTQNCHKNRRE